MRLILPVSNPHTPDDATIERKQVFFENSHSTQCKYLKRSNSPLHQEALHRGDNSARQRRSTQTRRRVRKHGSTPRGANSRNPNNSRLPRPRDTHQQRTPPSLSGVCCFPSSFPSTPADFLRAWRQSICPPLSPLPLHRLQSIVLQWQAKRGRLRAGVWCQYCRI